MTGIDEEERDRFKTTLHNLLEVALKKLAHENEAIDKLKPRRKNKVTQLTLEYKNDGNDQTSILEINPGRDVTAFETIRAELVKSGIASFYPHVERYSDDGYKDESQFKPHIIAVDVGKLIKDDSMSARRLSRLQSFYDYAENRLEADNNPDFRGR